MPVTPSTLAEGTHEFLLDCMLGIAPALPRRYARPTHVSQIPA